MHFTIPYRLAGKVISMHQTMPFTFIGRHKISKAKAKNEGNRIIEGTICHGHTKGK